MKTTLNILCMFALLLIFSEGGWSWSVLSKAPIDVDKFTVVIIEETEDRHQLPTGQLNAILSKNWKEYVEKEGGQWRVLDQNTDVSNDKDWVKQSLELERGELPWLIISDSDDGYCGIVPGSAEKLLDKIQREKIK